jgi:hypothetical protein
MHVQLLGGKADASVKSKLDDSFQKLNETLKKSKIVTGVRESTIANDGD